MTIMESLDRLQRDAGRHLLATPASEEDLRALEGTLGHPLPPPYRAFLVRFGGGLFYDRHELFGAHLVMIHDIEMVPALLTFRQRFTADTGLALPAGVVPIHRAGADIHLMRLAEADARVFSLAGSRCWPDFAAFLADVVLADAGP